MYDWDKLTALLAARRPGEPGTASGYHMVNYGHLIGEVIRRITACAGEFFAAHIAGPLGADFHIGLPPSEFHRVANVVAPPALPMNPIPSDPTQLDRDSVAFKTWTNPPTRSERLDRLAARRYGAANGHGNAHSLARLQSAVACGGEVDGVRLLSPQTIDRIFEVQSNGIDLVIGIPLKIGVGYSLLPEGRVCCWGGSGGSMVMIDVDHRMTFAYVMNKMAPGVVGPIAWRCSSGLTRS